MKHSDFRIGQDFTMSGARWRCTDIGTRTVVAIKLVKWSDVLEYRGTSRQRLVCRETVVESWFKGPPYAVVEHVIDECDFPACRRARRRA